MINLTRNISVISVKAYCENLTSVYIALQEYL